MSELLKLIDIEPDTPIERELLRMLLKHKIKFDAQPDLLGVIVSYAVQDAKDLPKAKELLYRVLHPRETGIVR
jgi:hypothetical protein